MLKEMLNETTSALTHCNKANRFSKKRLMLVFKENVLKRKFLKPSKRDALRCLAAMIFWELWN